MCVLMLLYIPLSAIHMCPHITTEKPLKLFRVIYMCVLMLLYIPLSAIYVCPHITTEKPLKLFQVIPVDTEFSSN
jgi:hypothetical protein